MLLFFVGLFKTIQSLTFYNPAENYLNIIQNRGFLPDMLNSYARWPNKAMDIKNDAYKTGMKCSATVKIIFYTNSSHLYINYTKSKIYTYQHLSHWATSGFALYGADEDGSLHLCMPEIDPNTFTTFSALLNYYLLPEKITEYHLILSSFDEVNQLNIGVVDGSYFEYAKSLNERPVVLYGTSIMHGACPCHAGNTWPNMLHRSIDFPIFNMGVTGNGKLESDVIKYILENDARVYVLDCLANLLGWSNVESLVYNAVKQIRAVYAETPIVLVEFGMYGNQVFNSGILATGENTNKAQRKAYERLVKEGVKNLYVVSTEELNYISDNIVDTLHPLDTGMRKHADALLKPLCEILDFHNSELTYKSQKAVSQYRFLGFRERHYNLIEGIKQTKPKNVLLGDDIVSNWENRASFPSGYSNFGMFKDRIENVIWRVLHDEMYNYDANKIVVFAGGNNLETTSDDIEIVEGVKYLIEKIYNKQPNAQIILSGLIPRKGLESRISTINGKIQQMVSEQGKSTYKDLGQYLVSSGSIESSLYEADGIHLNDAGYEKLASALN